MPESLRGVHNPARAAELRESVGIHEEHVAVHGASLPLIVEASKRPGEIKDARRGLRVAGHDQVGLLGAWNSSLPILKQIGTAIRSFVADVRGAILSVKTAVELVLQKASDEILKLYNAVKPFIDFVFGLTSALVQTFTGNLFAIPLFVAGQLWLHVLPQCYKEPIASFLLDVFIRIVEFVPAKFPLVTLVRATTLTALQELRKASSEQKIGAMDTVARLFAGDIEFAAGFVTGLLQGILSDSSIGLLFEPLKAHFGALTSAAESLGELAGKTFKDAAEGLEALGKKLENAKPVDKESLKKDLKTEQVKVEPRPVEGLHPDDEGAAPTEDGDVDPSAVSEAEEPEQGRGSGRRSGAGRGRDQRCGGQTGRGRKGRSE